MTIVKAKFRNAAIGLLGVWLVLYSYNAMTSGVAEKVIAEEITGVVVEKGTGKPVPNAVVMIRFERGNTGHGSPDCFRSVATESDVNGRFRFEPWTQEDTHADSFYGEITAYKKGYAIPRSEGEYIRHSRRTFLGIRFSKNLHIPKTETRVELTDREVAEKDRVIEEAREKARWVKEQFLENDPRGRERWVAWPRGEEWRMTELGKAVSEFVCRVNKPSEAVLLISRIRDEIIASPLADARLSTHTTNRSWIEGQLEEINK